MALTQSNRAPVCCPGPLPSDALRPKVRYDSLGGFSVAGPNPAPLDTLGLPGASTKRAARQLTNETL